MSTFIKNSSMLSKLKSFVKENESKLVLFVGFLLVSVISFEIGVLNGQKWQQKPLIIEKQVSTSNEGEKSQDEQFIASKGVLKEENGATIDNTKEVLNIQNQNNDCVYIGSKNSTKFYLSTCSWAKSIKPENVVCFKNTQEAISKGRTESKCTK